MQSISNGLKQWETYIPFRVLHYLFDLIVIIFLYWVPLAVRRRRIGIISCHFIHKNWEFCMWLQIIEQNTETIRFRCTYTAFAFAAYWVIDKVFKVMYFIAISRATTAQRWKFYEHNFNFVWFSVLFLIVIILK